MDPNATIDRIVNAIEDSEFPEAREAIRDLQTWVARGGFAPQIAWSKLDFLLQELADRLPRE